jgi:hypothetical protein
MNKDTQNLIYMAGLMDGEGTFYLGYPKNGRGKRYRTASVIVTNTNVDVMDWLIATYGGYRWLRKRPNPKHKPCYRWNLNGKKAEELALKLQPYLIIKREQVKRVFL